MRRTAPLLALALLASCTEEPPPAPPRNPATPAPARPADAPPSATTGLVRLEEGLRTWREVVEELERKAAAAKGDASAGPTPSEVAGAVEGVTNFLVAAELAVAAEARELVARRHALLVRSEAELHRRIGEGTAEAEERDRIIAGVLKGTREVPEGRTLAELQDSVADLREEIRQHHKDLADLKVQMADLEALLKQERIEPTEDTLLARERDAFKALLARAEALARR